MHCYLLPTYIQVVELTSQIMRKNSGGSRKHWKRVDNKTGGKARQGSLKVGRSYEIVTRKKLQKRISLVKAKLEARIKFLSAPNRIVLEKAKRKE